ncbi:MAG: DEAD/DEAH box helicase family protein [Rhodobacteraceae bacterium]|nr:DEAD/DEAH box helicase family protein [Paracoccaceae bacterium]
MNEAGACRKYVVPKPQTASCDNHPHAINEQRILTDRRIVFADGKDCCGKQKRADYFLRYSLDIPIAIVEAKARYKQPAEGLQQAMEYAEILGLRFAYATNGKDIVEFDFTTGIEKELSNFPTPADLWTRLRHADGPDDDRVARRLLTPTFPGRAKPLRYYQEIAVNRAIQEVLEGRKRALLTLCTGAAKTIVAFQICWKLWQARWNAKGNSRRTKLLFLAKRNFHIDEPIAMDSWPKSPIAPVARDHPPDRNAAQHARTDCVNRWVLNPRLTRWSETTASADAGD